MIDSIYSLARTVTTRMLRRANLPADYVLFEDVAQEVVLEFMDRCQTILDPDRLRGWLWTVMARKLKKLLDASAHTITFADPDAANRRSRHARRTNSPPAELLVELDASESRARRASRSRVVSSKRASVSAALRELTPCLRRVAVRRGLWGWTHEEIAESLGITPTASRVYWHRSRRFLEARLSDEKAMIA
jgi:RNA polymerase sigma factor (sigma-70 family)